MAASYPLQSIIAAKASSRISTPAYSLKCHLNVNGAVWVSRLNAIHFQGRLPWPDACGKGNNASELNLNCAQLFAMAGAIQF